MTLQQIRLIMAAAIACLVAAPFVLNPFSITLLNYIGIYSLAAIGLALLTGVGGIVSFGQAAFVGVAAYATAWVTAVNGYSPWLGLILAVVLTCSIAAILGFVTLRLGGHFLSLSTVAWGLAIAFLFGNIDGLGQHNGISGIPPISIGPVALVESRQIYFLIWAIVVAILLLCYNLLDSRIGRAMRALRGGNTLVESLGISAFQIKLVTFVIAAFLGALSGWLYAHLGRFVSPGPFDASMGIEYLMMAMVGGAGSILGGVVGAALVTLLKNSVQDYLPLIAKGASGQLEIVAFSALFILFLQRARQGIVPFLAGFLPDLKQSRPQAATALPRREQPAPGTLLLKVSDAQRRFGGLVAVNNVSFEVRSGEILAVIGPNGAGKSTIFNLISRIYEPTGGRLVFQGTDITNVAPHTIAGRGIARTFQNIELFEHATVLDNLLIGRHCRSRPNIFSELLFTAGVRQEELRHRTAVEEIIDFLDLANYREQRISGLPYGVRKVVELARALCAEPKLLLLDEPASGLNTEETEEVAFWIEDIKNDLGITVIMIEHDMSLVSAVSDRVLALNNGRTLALGTPQEVQSNPAVIEAYLGSEAE
jgi:branched-chain amino acid transport system permease protein